MLYPTTVSPSPETSNFFIIPNSYLFVFPFTLDANQAYDSVIVHAAGTMNQDHSLRAWVSKTVGDGPLHVPHYLSFWHPNRMATEIITIYDRAMAPPEGKTHPLALDPGGYYIHVLNLANRENAFTYLLTELV